MKNTTIHAQVAPFEVSATGHKDIHLAKLEGWYIVLVHINDDTTPLLQHIAKLHHRFKVQECVVFAVGDQPLDELEVLKTRLELPYYLISDKQLTEFVKGPDDDGYAVMIDDGGILRARTTGEPELDSARQLLDEVKMMHAALDIF